MLSDTNSLTDTKKDKIASQPPPKTLQTPKRKVRNQERPKIAHPRKQQLDNTVQNDEPSISKHGKNDDDVIKALQVENEQLKEKLLLLQEKLERQKLQSEDSDVDNALSSIQRQWNIFKTATTSSLFSSSSETNPSDEIESMVEISSMSTNPTDTSLHHRRILHHTNHKHLPKKKLKQSSQKILPNKAKISDDEGEETVAQKHRTSTRQGHLVPKTIEESTQLHEDSHVTNDVIHDEENLGLLSSPSKYEASTSQNIQTQTVFCSQLKDRGGWLVGLLILQSMSSFILEYNEKLLKKHIIIVNFLTMLVGAGGNAGNQASVRVIRGLAVRTLNDRTRKQFLVNEFKMALCLSSILGVAGLIRALIFRTPVAETIAITSSLFMIVAISIGLGSLLPLGMKFCGIDPAHSSTTIQVLMDILGVTITCQVSRLVLKQDWLINITLKDSD